MTHHKEQLKEECWQCEQLESRVCFKHQTTGNGQTYKRIHIKTHKEQLRKRFKEEYLERLSLPTPDEIVNWWNNNTIPKSSLQALVEKIEGMKKLKETKCYSCDEECTCFEKDEIYNQALSLCKAMVEELLTKENE